MSTKLSPVKATPYMSVVEGRSPRQKVHTHLSHAKNAFDTPKHNNLVPGRGQYTHGWGSIYEYVNGDWVEIYVVSQPTEKDFVPNSRYADKYETRPWRTNDHRQPLPAVRTPSDSQAEPAPGSHSDVEGVPGGSDERGRAGDDQRASRSSDDLQVGLTQKDVLAEAHRALDEADAASVRWADKGWSEDKEQMLQMRARFNALLWVAERMPNGTVNTKSAE